MPPYFASRRSSHLAQLALLRTRASWFAQMRQDSSQTSGEFARPHLTSSCCPVRVHGTRLTLPTRRPRGVEPSPPTISVYKSVLAFATRPFLGLRCLLSLRIRRRRFNPRRLFLAVSPHRANICWPTAPVRHHALNRVPASLVRQVSDIRVCRPRDSNRPGVLAHCGLTAFWRCLGPIQQCTDEPTVSHLNCAAHRRPIDSGEF